MRRLVSVASAVILVAIIGLCLSNDGQAKAGSDTMVHPPALNRLPLPKDEVAARGVDRERLVRREYVDF